MKTSHIHQDDGGRDRRQPRRRPAPRSGPKPRPKRANETLLIVTEAPPQLDGHPRRGCQTGRAYEVSWNTHDRLMDLRRQEGTPTATITTTTPSFEPELATEWNVGPNFRHLQTAQGRQVPRRHADHTAKGREVVVRQGRSRSAAFPEPSRWRRARCRSPSQFVAVDDETFPRRLPAVRQAHHARHRRAGAGDHELGAVQRKNATDKDPWAMEWCKKQPCLGRRLQGREMASPARR